MYPSKYGSERTLNLLRDAIDRGEVELTLVIGPPRTVTTALAGALGQSKDVGVQHVFHEIFGDGRHNPLIDFIEDPERKKPQHIVIKEMAACSLVPELMRMSKHCIFTTREPLQVAMAGQYGKTNAATKIQNFSIDHLPGKQGVHTDPTETEKFKEFKSGFNYVDMKKNNEWLNEVTSYHGQENAPEISVLDGDIFRMMPEETLRQLAKKSGISYQDQMVSGWSQVHDTGFDSWCRTYKKSSGIQRPQQTTPFVEGIYDKVKYPFESRHYCSMLASAFTIWPEATADKASLDLALDVMAESCKVKSRGTMLEHISGKTSTKMRFDEMEPNTAYAYIASYIPLNEQERETQSSYLKELRERRREHVPAFDAIDENIQKARTPSTTLLLTEDQELKSPDQSIKIS